MAHTYTFTAEQLERLQSQAAQLAVSETLEAIRKAGYSEPKVSKTSQHIRPLGHELNNQLCAMLAETPEARHWFPRPHLE